MWYVWSFVEDGSDSAWLFRQVPGRGWSRERQHTAPAALYAQWGRARADSALALPVVPVTRVEAGRLTPDNCSIHNAVWIIRCTVRVLCTIVYTIQYSSDVFSRSIIAYSTVRVRLHTVLCACFMLVWDTNQMRQQIHFLSASTPRQYEYRRVLRALSLFSRASAPLVRFTRILYLKVCLCFNKYWICCTQIRICSGSSLIYLCNVRRFMFSDSVFIHANSYCHMRYTDYFLSLQHIPNKVALQSLSARSWPFVANTVCTRKCEAIFRQTKSFICSKTINQTCNQINTVHSIR